MLLARKGTSSCGDFLFAVLEGEARVEKRDVVVVRRGLVMAGYT